MTECDIVLPIGRAILQALLVWLLGKVGAWKGPACLYGPALPYRKNLPCWGQRRLACDTGQQHCFFLEGCFVHHSPDCFHPSWDHRWVVKA